MVHEERLVAFPTEQDAQIIVDLTTTIEHARDHRSGWRINGLGVPESGPS
jgi:hypothetical protein